MSMGLIQSFLSPGLFEISLRLLITLLPYHAAFSTHIEPFQRPFYSDGAQTTLQGEWAFGVINFHNILILDHLYLDIYMCNHSDYYMLRRPRYHAINKPKLEIKF